MRWLMTRYMHLVENGFFYVLMRRRCMFSANLVCIHWRGWIDFLTWWSNVKGHCDLTKQVFDHNSQIHTLIITQFNSNVYEDIIKWWHFISKWSKVNYTVTSCSAKTFQVIIQCCNSGRGGIVTIFACDLAGWWRPTIVRLEFNFLFCPKTLMCCCNWLLQSEHDMINQWSRFEALSMRTIELLLS